MDKRINNELYVKYLHNVLKCQQTFGKVSYDLLETHFKGTYNYLTRVAKAKAVEMGNPSYTVWDLIGDEWARFEKECPSVNLDVKRFVTAEMVVSALKTCQEKNGFVSNKTLCEIDKGVYYYLSKIASMRKSKGENLDLWDVALEYFPEEDGKPQIIIKRKPNYKDYTIQSLKDCQEKYKKVTLADLSKEWPKAYQYISHAVGVINKKNNGNVPNVTMADVCVMMVPSIKMEENFVYDSEIKVLQALALHADKDGVVDTFRADKPLYGAVPYNAWIEQQSTNVLGKTLYVSVYMSDTLDLIEEHRRKIAEVYGEHGTLDGISVDHPELYMLLRTIRENLGGKAYTMQETARYLGFNFESAEEESPTKIDGHYVFAVLKSTYPDGVVKNLSSHPEALYAVTALARIKGVSIGEIVESYGMTYERAKGDGEGKGRGRSKIKKIMVKRELPASTEEENEG